MSEEMVVSLLKENDATQQFFKEKLEAANALAADYATRLEQVNKKITERMKEGKS